MSPTALALGVVLLALAIVFIREALRIPLLLPAFALFMLGSWMVVGHPVALLMSSGGWIIVLFMVWGARILATTLHAGIGAARNRQARR